VNRRALLGLGFGVAAWPGLAAGPPGKTLRLAVSAPPASLDPHYYTLTPNIMVSSHMFETLVQRDTESRMQPGLAESWRLLDEATWEFTLRDGVRFHDGLPLSAEDVAYTLARVPTVASPSSFAVYTRAIKAVEVAGPRTVRFKTDGPYPLLPNDLSSIFILPHTLGPDVPSSDFNSGKAMNGTGPFRFESYQSGSQVLMTRNAQYWGEPAAWGRVDYRVVTNAAARVAALLSGDVDLIDNVPTTDAAKLRTDARVAIAECPSLRLIFLGLDTFRDGPTPDVSGPNGEALAQNPLRDRRVREALSIAINRPAIVDRVMEGAAAAAGQFMPAGTFGYTPDLPPPRFDPAKARALLAEAGFPNGLTVTLHGPNDRYVNDVQILQAVAQQWTRVGVRTQVAAVPLANLIARLSRFECSVYLLGWSNSGGEPSLSLRAVLGGRDTARGTGLSNFGRYANPQVDRLTDEALKTLDDAKREALLQGAMRMAMQDTAVVPLHHQKNVWATRRSLRFTPRIDEQSLATSASLAPS